VLGLIGPVCAGKSEVGRRLRELGATIFEADRVVRELYDQAEVRSEVRALLGDDVFDASGAVNRSAIAERVFGSGGDPVLRRRLTEEIIFPRTGKLLAEQIEAFRARATGGDVFVVDAPTLYEAGRANWCDRILLVTAPVARRRQWSADRGWPAGELERRDAAMIPEEVKRGRADFVIENTGSVRQLERAVDRVWEQVGGALEKNSDSD
jgi:dephospho-CoA kinase